MFSLIKKKTLNKILQDKKTKAKEMSQLADSHPDKYDSSTTPYFPDVSCFVAFLNRIY